MGEKSLKYNSSSCSSRPIFWQRFEVLIVFTSCTCLLPELETFQNDPQKSERKERKTNPLCRNTILSNKKKSGPNSEKL